MHKHNFVSFVILSVSIVLCAILGQQAHAMGESREKPVRISVYRLCADLETYQNRLVEFEAFYRDVPEERIYNKKGTSTLNLYYGNGLLIQGFGGYVIDNEVTLNTYSGKSVRNFGKLIEQYPNGYAIMVMQLTNPFNNAYPQTGLPYVAFPGFLGIVDSMTVYPHE